MLSSEDRAILDFERGWWTEPGPKDQAIEMSLGLTSRSYYERLLVLVQTRDAFDYDPLTTKRVLSILHQDDSELAVL
jgi:hypothetical protein